MGHEKMGIQMFVKIPRKIKKIQHKYVQLITLIYN